MEKSTTRREALVAIGAGLGMVGSITTLGILGTKSNREWAANERARIERLTRRDIIGTIRNKLFTAAKSETNFGFGLNFDGSFGPKLETEHTPAALLLAIDEHPATENQITAESPQVVTWKIQVETRKISEELLQTLSDNLTDGTTIKIAKGIEHEKGTLTVNPEDISIIN